MDTLTELRELTPDELASTIGGLRVNKLTATAEELLGLPPPTLTQQLLNQIQGIVDYFQS